MPASPYEALIFDMDGTLTVPAIDFKALRRELDIPAGDIAHAILAWPAAEQARAWAIVERHEREALDRLRLQDGCLELLTECRRAGLRLGLLTRNAQSSVDELCRRFDLHFDGVVTRDFPFIKPHPEPVLHMLRPWNVAPADALVVGDYVHDLECGRAAGTKTCFFQNPGFPDWSAEADFTVRTMKELRAVIFGRDGQ